jgi:hypothetical protein
VIVGAGTKFDFLDFDRDLFFLRLVRPFLFFVKKLSVINNPATGGLAFGATSTKSLPSSRARCTASRESITPSWLPSSSMTLTEGTRMRSFVR